MGCGGSKAPEEATSIGKILYCCSLPACSWSASRAPRQHEHAPAPMSASVRGLSIGTPGAA